MKKVRPISPYLESRKLEGNPLLKYVVTKKDPNELVKKSHESPRFEQMDEESVTNSIPIQKFKPNHLSKKEKSVEQI